MNDSAHPTGWFDRHRKPITYEQYQELAANPNYVLVFETRGLPGVYIKTEWLGYDRGYMVDEPGSLFQTVVEGGVLDGFKHCYSTEQEAGAAHHAIMYALMIILAREGKYPSNHVQVVREALAKQSR